MFLSEQQINRKPISELHAGPLDRITHGHRSVARALLGVQGMQGSMLIAMLQSVKCGEAQTPPPCATRRLTPGASRSLGRWNCHHRGSSSCPHLTTKATFRQTWSVRPALGAQCQPTVNLVTSTKALQGRHGHPRFTDDEAEALKIPGAHPREGQSPQVCRDQSNSEPPREPSLPLDWGEVGCRGERGDLALVRPRPL